MQLSRYARFCWGTIAFTLAVILWGAFVRATGSGAGCGSHWPLCNGAVVPRAPQIETLIELTHRATSGIALLMVLAMAVWAFRIYPARHRVRRAAAASLAIMVLEALLGAGLVLFELVAHDASMARAMFMAAHLVNTFLLLGAMTVTAWWASGGAAVRLRGQGPAGALLAVAVAGMMLLGASGAVTALGDTLYAGGAVAEGVRADQIDFVYVLVQLRVLHPAIALAVGFYLCIAALLVQRLRPGATTRALAQALITLFLVQIGVGFLNVWLMAPVWMQLVHLLLADFVWMALVVFGLAALARREPDEGAEPGSPRSARLVATG
jgi:heme a synthase